MAGRPTIGETEKAAGGDARADLGQLHQRLEPQATKVPTDLTAFLAKEALPVITDPKQLNSGNVYDIYAQSTEDFEAPLPLHVTYEVRGITGMKTIHEQMWVDTLYAEQRPRIVTSVQPPQPTLFEHN